MSDIVAMIRPSRLPLLGVILVFLLPLIGISLTYPFRDHWFKNIHTLNQGQWVKEAWTIPVPATKPVHWQVLYVPSINSLDTEEEKAARFLMSQIPKTLGTHRTRVSTGFLPPLKGVQTQPEPGFYIADPKGRLILFYPTMPDAIKLGQTILHDLKILLKNSQTSFKEIH